MASVNFRDPPVVEVALSVQFEAVPGLASYRSGELYGRWSGEYPVVSQQSELSPLPPLDAEEGDLFLQVGGSSGSRLWFEAEDGGYLIQLQADRLTVNWRRLTTQAYPRYPEVRSRFVAAWDGLVGALGGPPDANQIEVIYVNRVPRSPDRVLQGWDNPICVQEDGRFNAVFERSLRLPAARLAKGQTALGGHYGEPTETMLSLIVRAVPEVADMPIFAIDAAREYIVTRFKAITDTLMHEEWGVVDGSDA